MADASEDTELIAAVRDRATRYSAPPGLRDRVGAALAQMAEPVRPRASGRRWFAWPWLRIAGAVSCGFAAGLLLAQIYFRPADAARVSDEVLAAHVRSLMAAHLEDIASSDQHTVKPWFAGKVDFSPPVNDFSAQGFPLVGGRLDYIDKQYAAALVYRRHGHVINVFVWPVRDADAAKELNVSRDGYELVAWHKSGMQYWIVSDVNRDELLQFSTLLHREGT